MNPQELRKRALALLAKAQEIQAKADASEADLTEAKKALDEHDRLMAMAAEAEKVAERMAQAAAQHTSRVSTPAPVGVECRRVEVAGPGASAHGFKHEAEFYGAVIQAGVGRGFDNRLQGAATTYANEGTGADGGFLVPPDFRQGINQVVENPEESLLARCDVVPVNGNGLSAITDENTAHGTSGVTTAWTAEGGVITQSKPALRPFNVPLHKLAALVPITDELASDAAAMTAYLNRKVPERINFAITDAIVAGSGAGKPLGMLNAPCKVEVAKETSQVAATVVAANIVKMYNRLAPQFRRSAVWLINQDVEQQLQQMTLAGSVGGPLYMPPGGLSAAPYATLLGKPVIALESCSAVGTAGDIILVDPKNYCAVVKSGGIRQDYSIHVYFDQGMGALRFTVRVGGQPWLSSAIARKNGTNTHSSIVTLAVRS